MEEQTKTKRHMLRHTPGPWNVRKGLNPNNTDYYWVEIRHSGWKEIICPQIKGCVDHPGGEEFQGAAEANAHLIAQAPTLLHYLKIAVEIIKNEYPEHQWADYKVLDMIETIFKAESRNV